MKMYDYLIAYNFNAEGYLGPCSGTMQMSRNKKIKTFDAVKEVTNYIIDRLNDTGQKVNNVSIYNIILLGRNKH
jgi:hypothetical protein